MNFLFLLICLFHIFIWVFVLLGFIWKSTATINVFFVIPLIYIVHILPFHLLIESKKRLQGEDWEVDAQRIDEYLYIPYYFGKFQKGLEQYCFQSPLSPQGMLILGLLLSSYRLLLFA